MATIKTISPVDGRVCAERVLASAAEIDRTLERARAEEVRRRAERAAESADSRGGAHLS